jgi:hypothetical protein
MDLHTLARGSGLVGGLCWLVLLGLDRGGSAAGGVADLLHGAGLVLLALALAAAGAGLVSGGASWLRAIVAVALPLLVWSVLEVLHPAGDPEVIDGAFGLVMVVVSVLGLVRGRHHGEQRGRSAGAHAR